jgi:ketosteroid isomerase-like protein
MAMELTGSQEAEVIETMQQYATAYRKKDIKAFSALFSPHITGFGSGPDEIITDHKTLIRQITRDISQATILSVEFRDRHIFGDGRVAWVTSRSTIVFTIDGTGKQVLEGRSTMVLRNTGSRWLIEQLHFSMPFGGQSAGQSFPGA